jgi:hypothetical protein
MIVYVAVLVGPMLFDVSLAKKFRVEFVLTVRDSGLGALVLDVVGVEPSVV